MIPVLETERLILRGMVRGDFAAFAAIWTEPEVVRFIGGKARTEAESWSSFLRNAGSWAMDGFGQWGIFRKADGILLGTTGFFRAMRGVGADFDATPEAGWVLSAQSHGKGYGPEAVEAAHAWFDRQPFGGSSGAMIDVGHAVSLRLAAWFGYKLLREAEFSGDKVLLFCAKPQRLGALSCLGMAAVLRRSVGPCIKACN